MNCCYRICLMGIIFQETKAGHVFIVHCNNNNIIGTIILNLILISVNQYESIVTLKYSPTIIFSTFLLQRNPSPHVGCQAERSIHSATQLFHSQHQPSYLTAIHTMGIFVCIASAAVVATNGKPCEWLTLMLCVLFIYSYVYSIFVGCICMRLYMFYIYSSSLYLWHNGHKHIL